MQPKKLNRKFVFMLSVIILFASGCSFIYRDDTDKQTPNIDKQPYSIEKKQFEDQGVKEDVPTIIELLKPTGKTTLLVSAVGDIMMHMPQIRAGELPDGGYDFKDVFQEIKPYIEKADIAIANLETTISTPEKGYSGYPRFKAPHQLLEALKFAGFDVLITANNHCLDGLEFGLENTLNKIDEYEILCTGTARNPEESNRLLIIEKKGIKVGILAYTYGTNGMEAFIPQEKLKYMVNYYSDFDKVEQDIKRMKEAGAEVVVACMHWGNEYQRMPNAEQKKLADQLVEAGVDIIFGSHPHVIQPIEVKSILLSNGTEKKALVVYSLGNFVSNQRKRYTDSGVIVNVEVVKDYDNNTVSINRIEYIPTWVHKYYRNGKPQYKILPVEKYMNGELKGADGERIQAVWHETTGLLGDKEIDLKR